MMTFSVNIENDKGMEFLLQIAYAVRDIFRDDNITPASALHSRSQGTGCPNRFKYKSIGKEKDPPNLKVHTLRTPKK